ncbi:MAG: aminoacyl-tRNA deacylase [Cardiobacteriaceae bacterium]|nr:aminoacyl-tRNA deacylase [Cardiobacteriaceae bacterium]
MSKIQYPVTPAIRFLREHRVAYEPFLYPYEEHGGTAQSALHLGVDEHCVVKSIVLMNEQKQGMIVLMHGDLQISTKKLARDLGMKQLEPANATIAQKWTGYLFGGTSPFGIKSALPIYAEKSIQMLDKIYINGGKRGFLVGISPKDLMVLDVKWVEVGIS